MYTVNLLSFDHRYSLTGLEACLQQFAVQVVRIPIDQFLQQLALPHADINIFLYSPALLDKAAACPRLTEFLGSSSCGSNLCVIPDGSAVNSRVVAHFLDFLFWPCTPFELESKLARLARSVQRVALDKNSLLAEFASLNLIGKSPQFVDNIQLIKKVAACHAAVLIQGETGTGKENAARAIHYLGKRREKSFVPINCAAIPDDILESELFGHEKGAFTDAKQTQAGLVAIADGGTLFLDEIDSLTPKAQAALLRFLQTQEYRPLGARQTFRADVRILAATNADLKYLVANKYFREDLYFRLNVLNLTMPPLRHRLEDIALIADSMLQRFAQEYQQSPKQLSRAGLAYLMGCEWPGNIRELENCLLRAFLLSPGTLLEFMDALPLEMQTPIKVDAEYMEKHVPIEDVAESIPPLSFQDAKAMAITEFEANYLRRVMSIAQGNVSAAARIAGKERRALGKLLQKYAIDKTQFQSRGATPVARPNNQAVG
jgi:DNA-binding NtrC family response regulator